MSLGTRRLKSSYDSDWGVLPLVPSDSYFPTKRISPRSADGSGQVGPQATMPIMRATSSIAVFVF